VCVCVCVCVRVRVRVRVCVCILTYRVVARLEPCCKLRSICIHMESTFELSTAQWILIVNITKHILKLWQH